MKTKAPKMTAAELESAIALTLKCSAKYIQPRLVGLKIGEGCTRCGGYGQYSYCQMYGSTCFKCGGTGYQKAKLTKELLAKCQEIAASGQLDEYIAELKRVQEAKKIANGWWDKCMDVWGQHPDVADEREKKVAWYNCSEAHHAANHKACSIIDKGKAAETELKYGIYYKGDDKKQHHRKLTPAETIERANYLQSILDELTAWVDSAKKAKGGD